MIIIVFSQGGKVSHLLKERENSDVGFNGTFATIRRKKFFVISGTRFEFVNWTLKASGPLLNSVGIFIESRLDTSAEYEVEIVYAVRNRRQETYEWVARGWSPCTRNCGGGRQHATFK